MPYKVSNGVGCLQTNVVFGACTNALMILCQHKGLCWSRKNVEFCRPVVSVCICECVSCVKFAICSMLERV